MPVRIRECESHCDINLTSCLETSFDLRGEKTTHTNIHRFTHPQMSFNFNFQLLYFKIQTVAVSLLQTRKSHKIIMFL